MTCKIIHGDCLDIMRTFESESIETICCDPPYGLKFMGKKWDHGLPPIEIWQEALRISTPGTWLLAFGGTRTYHRLTCSIEDAGWEIRDCIMWLYGSGFPKGKGNLKPAYEPIILARKKSTCAFVEY
jgi:DNA modification methylase